MQHLNASQKLRANADQSQQLKLADLFKADPDRAQKMTLEGPGICLDYSKNLLTQDTLDLFADLSSELELQTKVEAMFQGEHLNNTEDRAALHTLLRCPRDKAPMRLNAEAEAVSQALAQVKRISEQVQTGQWRGFNGKAIKHLLHIGIGGSYLGPDMVDEALAGAQYPQHLDCHYVANVDGAHIDRVLKQLPAAETLVIIVSKSFSTLETMTNARSTQSWLLEHMGHEDLAKHLVAITTNVSAAVDFGIAEQNLIPIWDWVGGRYSLWSGVGLPIAIRYGFEVFEALLDGAYRMDQHFREAPYQQNMPVLLAWISTYYQSFFSAESHAVLPYDHGLRRLPEHLQQVDMESNGKTLKADATAVQTHTGAILWGGEGSNGQHAFHQLLHQGTRFVGIDFILPLKPSHQRQEHHDHLVASCLSQAQALMLGRPLAEIPGEDPFIKAHRVMPGNRPSNMLLLDAVTPSTIGALVALYEHKVFCQAMIWQINPFDQWGVELGKEMGAAIYDCLQSGEASLDASTDALIKRYREANSK